MNILHILHLYFLLKDNPSLTITPRTYLFGGKAAASYGEAKETIRLINVIARMINGDRTVSQQLKVLFLENYNVSWDSSSSRQPTSVNRFRQPARKRPGRGI